MVRNSLQKITILKFWGLTAFPQILDKLSKVSEFLSCCHHLDLGVGEHSHYGGDVDIRLQRPLFLPEVSESCFQCCWLWLHIFADLSLSTVTQRPHIFWWNVGSSITLKDPLFFWPPQEATFNSISSTNWSFLSFSTIFFQIPILKPSLKDQR